MKCCADLQPLVDVYAEPSPLALNVAHASHTHTLIRPTTFASSTITHTHRVEL